MIVSHREMRIDHHRRLESGQWLATSYTNAEDEVELPALQGSVRAEEIYAKVDPREGMRE